MNRSSFPKPIQPQIAQMAQMNKGYFCLYPRNPRNLRLDWSEDFFAGAE
jgi:hypothetical protein